MSAGNAQLLIGVAEQSNIVLKFQRVRWHEFTAVYNCSTDQIQSAYFKLMRLDDSERLAKYVMADGAAPKAYTQLHHFRISLRKRGKEEPTLAGSSGKLGLRVTSVGKYA
jgi:hypothetical protein